MPPALAVLGPSLLAVIGIVYARRLYRFPASRLAPDAVKHTWVGGIGYSGVLVGFLMLPPVLLRHWDVAAVALVAAVVMLAGPYREIALGLSGDLRKHRAEGRGLFQHDDTCVVHPGRRHPRR